jgi:hypothetical protein
MAIMSVLYFSFAEAMPVPARTPDISAQTDVVRVQTLCDYRGCFGFGPRQWYRPPTYRPPGYQPPVYYRPRAAGPPRLIYQPPSTAAVPARPIAPTSTTSTKHMLYCSAKYRSYDAASNTYRTHGGREQVCRSPYR